MTQQQNSAHGGLFAFPAPASFGILRTPKKFAPVVPLSIAKHLQDLGCLGNYHLLLAHDVLAHPDEYRAVYGGRSYTILMDNSLVELGYAMPLREVIEASNIVGAQYAILPDKLNDLKTTLDMTFAALSEWRSIPREVRGDIKLLPVMQGATESELMQMLHSLCLNTEIQGMCVPRVIADTLGTRAYIINEVAKFFRIHMLGFSENLLDDMACARMPSVIGIDSAVPVRAGLRGLLLSMENPVDVGKRECYWDRPFDLEPRWPDDFGKEDKLSLIGDNLTLVRGWIGGGAFTCR